MNKGQPCRPCNRATAHVQRIFSAAKKMSVGAFNQSSQDAYTVYKLNMLMEKKKTNITSVMVILEYAEYKENMKLSTSVRLRSSNGFLFVGQ